ncbi:diacylglycerol/lipid kinase family protein [Deinococcus yavapaiensis]|uniref:Diacylglycerol kinase family enzyme n=1 Tax=Deinococcus yavapaiensis KR-236 TaxID=694435 RepID=A0A318S0U0_9DEIO|nr:diacylglycerol kinase family protein [Deinococcus yavapaiensis]PYE49386.1 diacylglycerol kinase family enzyme [Deinococcus yavapaiensis KR-236]
MTQATPPKRLLVVFNPKSGQGSDLLRQFVMLAEGQGLSLEMRELTTRDPGEHLHDLQSYDALVAAGGDGTVSSVAYAARNTNIPILAVPVGTANLIAQNLALPTDALGLLEVVRVGHTLRVDLGELEVKGERAGFAMLAGAGADAAMIKESEDLKKRFGSMAYVISAMRQVNPKRTTFHVIADGEKREFEGIGVMIANMGMANYRMPITSDISPRDGRFTVILLTAGNILQLVPNLIDSLLVKFDLADPMFSGNLETFQASEVQVDAVEPFPMQYDGELHVETTPFTARILPGAVRFLTLERPTDIET